MLCSAICQFLIENYSIHHLREKMQIKIPMFSGDRYDQSTFRVQLNLVAPFGN